MTPIVKFRHWSSVLLRRALSISPTLPLSEIDTDLLFKLPKILPNASACWAAKAAAPVAARPPRVAWEWWWWWWRWLFEWLEANPFVVGVEDEPLGWLLVVAAGAIDLRLLQDGMNDWNEWLTEWMNWFTLWGSSIGWVFDSQVLNFAIFFFTSNQQLLFHLFINFNIIYHLSILFSSLTSVYKSVLLHSFPLCVCIFSSRLFSSRLFSSLSSQTSSSLPLLHLIFNDPLSPLASLSNTSYLLHSMDEWLWENLRRSYSWTPYTYYSRSIGLSRLNESKKEFRHFIQILIRTYN